MKQIKKGEEPKELADWKKENENLEEYYTILTKIAKDALHNSLLREQGFICCYCERRIVKSSTQSHIEHFRPQRFFVKGTPDYDENSLDYENLLCSCGDKEEDGAVTNHCGNVKRGWFDEDLLISPLENGCESRFEFTDDGEIQPALESDSAAIKTISKIGLGIPKLNALRAEAIEPFLDDTLTSDELKRFVKGYLHIDSDGKYFPFWTTINQLFNSYS